MNNELLFQAMELFNTSDKWSAFVELASKTEEIERIWWGKLRRELLEIESEKGNPDWTTHIWGEPWDIGWYINGEPDNSIAIHFWKDSLRVVAYSKIDNDKLNNLFNRDERFSAIKRCFERLDGSNQDIIGWEDRNFSFDSINDFPAGSSKLSWYAGNETSDFANQIIRKVRKFQTPEITALFKEIIEKCSK